jgi:signal transduction histidine kinase
MKLLNTRLQSVLKSEKLIDDNNQLILDDPSRLLEVIDHEFERQDEISNKMFKDIEKLKVVLDTTPCTVSWINKDLTYEGINKTLAELCKLPSSEFIGKAIGYYSKDKYFYHFAEKLFQQNDTSIKEELIGHIDGEEKIFWVIGTKFDKGRRAVIMGIDVTEVRNLEQTITIMDKLSSLGEMVATIIHEVNNPLSSIKACAQLIPKFIEKNDLDKATQLSHKIDATTNKISQIIRGIKTFVRRGNTDPHETLRIKNLIEDAYIICEGRFKEKNIQFFLPNEEDSIILVTCNVTEIFQVLVNLMSNSIDAIEKQDERWIRISIHQENSTVKVVFTDSGNGIPESIAKNLFKSFYTTKAVNKGTGLGLSLCKKIMESHNGSIEVDSSQAHTTFVLTFTNQNITFIGNAV